MASISRTDLQHLAHLARIDLSDAELDLLGPQLSVILESVASVGEVATADVPGTSHAFRADVVVAPLGAAAVLAGAPAAEQDRFRVPRILDEEQ
jgi:aspartyl-tRNA(Asn)/glutamyl-tRNA(Gln) amidotransferase subunit C